MLPPNLKNGLVLDLDGTISGTTAYDQSGQGNNGTLVNSPTIQRIGANQKAFVLNGSNQYITIPTLNGNKSFSAWIKNSSAPSSGNVQTIFCNATDSGDKGIYEISYQNSGGTLRLYWLIYFGGGTSPVILYNITLGNSWYHVGFTWNGSILIAYLNGKVIGSANGSAGSANYGTYCNIGRYQDSNNTGGNRYWNGQICQPKRFNIALSGTEMQQLAFYKPLNVF